MERRKNTMNKKNETSSKLKEKQKNKERQANNHSLVMRGALGSKHLDHELTSTIACRNLILKLNPPYLKYIQQFEYKPR